MSGVSARTVIDAFGAWVEATPCADKAHANDGFVRLLNLSEFKNVEADRRFYVLIAEGPGNVTGSTCNDFVTLELTVRWLDKWESQGRMIDDLDALRKRIRAFSRAEGYVYTVKVVSEWRTDYVTLATSAVATIRIRIEYHRILP